MSAAVWVPLCCWVGGTLALVAKSRLLCYDAPSGANLWTALKGYVPSGPVAKAFDQQTLKLPLISDLQPLIGNGVPSFAASVCAVHVQSM
jgi:hypothetical protein